MTVSPDPPSAALVFNEKRSGLRPDGPSFSLRHRLFRLCWHMTWALLGAWTPVPFHPWRRLLLRLFGADLHASAKVYPGVKVWFPPNLAMGAHACLGPGVNCYSMAQIRLGDHALVSQGASLCAGSHDVDDPAFRLIARPITLESRCWVAAEAFVGPGVTIGEGAVLGARGVAFRDLAPNAVHAGNPARFIRMRAGGAGA